MRTRISILMILAIILVFSFSYAADKVAETGAKIEASSGMIKPTLKQEAVNTNVTAESAGLGITFSAALKAIGINNPLAADKQAGQPGIKLEEKKDLTAQPVIGANEPEDASRTNWQITGQAGKADKYGEVENKGPIVSE